MPEILAEGFSLSLYIDGDVVAIQALPVEQIFALFEAHPEAAIAGVSNAWPVPSLSEFNTGVLWLHNHRLAQMGFAQRFAEAYRASPLVAGDQALLNFMAGLEAPAPWHMTIIRWRNCRIQHLPENLAAHQYRDQHGTYLFHFTVDSPFCACKPGDGLVPSFFYDAQHQQAWAQWYDYESQLTGTLRQVELELPILGGSAPFVLREGSDVDSAVRGFCQQFEMHIGDCRLLQSRVWAQLQLQITVHFGASIHFERFFRPKIEQPLHRALKVFCNRHGLSQSACDAILHQAEGIIHTNTHAIQTT
ncbi:hypothetical protein B484DRAFT_431022 [Ochromonadaceae sp. CCMP2298]|nr:hypothetical protein B484DRAFT_431022 [Ochromonadaceae sp. CCMP2298]